MVKTVPRRALLRGCKLNFLRKEHSYSIMMLLFLFITLFLCNTPIRAADLGTHGTIYSIKEEDPVQLIQQKLKLMEERGELERHYLELQNKARASVEHPKPGEGITRAQKSRTFYYDPTYVVPRDLTDHLGRVFYKKGTKIHPLETVSLSQELLFLDGDDEEQKGWAKDQLPKACHQTSDKKSPNKTCSEINAPKIILVKGSPLSLAEDFNQPVYFDQGGLLCKKLGIQHVPALVTQEDLRLHIEEISLEGAEQ